MIDTLETERSRFDRGSSCAAYYERLNVSEAARRLGVSRGNPLSSDGTHRHPCLVGSLGRAGNAKWSFQGERFMSNPMPRTPRTAICLAVCAGLAGSVWAADVAAPETPTLEQLQKLIVGRQPG